MSRIHRVDYSALGFDTLFDRPARGALGLDQQLAYYEEYFDWAQAGRSVPVAEQTREWVAGQPSERDRARAGLGRFARRQHDLR